MQTITYFIAAVLISSMEPGGLLPEFRDSVLAGNVESAMGMFSAEAIMDVDSVLENHPGQVSGMLAFFGLPTELGEGGMNGGSFLEAVLSSPQVPALIMLLGVSPGTPLERGDLTLVPVSFGLYGSRDTVFVHIVEEDGYWRIRDYFEVLPDEQDERPVRG